ncbi:MAG TPA: hypothetical protein VEA80_13420 [Vitreimonas sp.]|uniref:hypothetical protein n=1 Tax=Vitreimonas sp. TaxID=3069702 RepID=UPI002D47B4EC|nr:hypothetical protein [Vitreimonas sp.]HYD88470.1 hypothetical protein [Vitreimonas sp.]
MRFLLFALACLFAAPAAAQSNAELQRASAALSAIWRPITGPLTTAAVETACAGAVQEMAAVEAALPPVLTPDSLARVRALRGFLIVPAGDDPAWAYFFPPPDLAWFRSGIGALTVLDQAQGLIGVRDASGQNIALQLGRAGEHAVLRVRPPQGGAPLAFVGCAASSAGD